MDYGLYAEIMAIFGYTVVSKIVKRQNYNNLETRGVFASQNGLNTQ